MSGHLAWRWMRRYKLCFLIGLVIFSIQVFLAYKSLTISDIATIENTQFNSNRKYKSAPQAKSHNKASAAGSQNSASDDESTSFDHMQLKRAAAAARQSIAASQRDQIGAEILGFEPECHIISKEAISALQRAKTKDCRKHIAHVACAIQAGHFYAQNLPSYCPRGNHTPNAELGCYRDEKDFRLLSGYFINFKLSNTPKVCIELCLQSGFPYAGVQYGTECFCGNEAPAIAAKLADSKCNMKCSGDAKEICGGYFSMNVFETGIAKFTAKIAETSGKSDMKRIRIAFLLTLNGRALRQVHRLLKALYSPDHVYYIHIDARQDYLYRHLLELETDFPNIRLARKRYSTIWGGASLLTMLLDSMRELLITNSWSWDFVINLSESDFPVKTIDKLVDFLTANRERNFVKSHGRETQRFIQKQGLDKTFVECDTHMWRIGDRQLPNRIQIDGGSDWVTLSRTFVQYLVSEIDTDALLTGLLVVFRHTLLPAESFFHTVLRNSRFCQTYVDNNLHVTNWKRKLGCKCQYKHVVDWCGCSPNDFKPDDWTRLIATEKKMLFFARKFEPIINQAVIFQLEEWLFGPYTSDYTNLHAYWQSFYNSNDIQTKDDDLMRTIGESLMRIMGHQLHMAANEIIELTHYLHREQYKGFLIRFHGSCHWENETICEIETRIRPVQYNKVAKNSKFARRLRNFEISSDFDPKEQISRNFGKILGPTTQLVLSFTLLGAAAAGASSATTITAHSYNLTLLWISPMGTLEDYSELHIEDMPHDTINHTRALLKQPLMPGIWTVKLIGRAGIYAQTKFLVIPLALENGLPISKLSRGMALNGGGNIHKQRNALPVDFQLPKEWQQHLPTPEEMLILENASLANAQRVGESLHEWIDELVGKFFLIRETCAVNEFATSLSTAAVHAIPMCKDTMWSSLAPDPKSDIKALLKRR